MTGRPPLEIGTHGNIRYSKSGDRWRATCLYRDTDGVTRPVERQRGTKAEATRAIAAAIRDRKITAGTGQLTGDSKVVQLMEVFWAWKLANAPLSASTKVKYSDVIERIIVPGLGNIRLREASTGLLDIWYLREREARRAQADLAKTILRQAFGLAARRDALQYNPAAALSIPRDEKEPVRVLTDDELKRMADALKSMRQVSSLSDILNVQYGLGLRIGEVLALNVKDLDLYGDAGRIVNINSTVITATGKPEVQPHTKDGPDGRRPVMAPEWVSEILTRRAANIGASGLLFVSRNETTLDPHNVRDSWRNIRNRFDLGWVKPHHLRKTAATRVDAMFGEEITSKFLGHKSTDVTRNYYLATKRKVAPDVTAALDKGIE